MAVMQLVLRYGERLLISTGNVVSARVFGFLKDEMYVGITFSSLLALGQYYLPDAWNPDWLVSFGGNVGELGTASQITHFSLRGMRLGFPRRIGVMVVMRVGFRYGERLSISRGNVVSARVFGFLKDEMYVGMTLSSLLALGQYYLPEAWIPDLLIYFFNYHFSLRAAIRLAAILKEGQELGAAAVIGGQDAAAVIGGQHDHGIANIQ